jgi:SAM-dependent methyltransferase
VSTGPDRSIRFVFDSVVDAYVSGRPDMPLEAVLEGARAAGVPAAARVLEIGAGAGQLTATLVEAGFDVVALEPGGELRRRTAARVPAATLRSETFEDFEPDGRFDAIFSANAFHWVDPGVGHRKAAELARALVLIWNTPFVADPDLRRRVQDEVMILHGSTFPTEEADVRQLVADETAAACERVRGSGRFREPWSHVYQRTLEYAPTRYIDLIGSMGYVAASGEREAIQAELAPILGTEPFDVVDLVWVIAVRALAR